MKIATLSNNVTFIQNDYLVDILIALHQNRELWQSPLATTERKQPRRKTGVAQARRIARKRRNRK